MTLVPVPDNAVAYQATAVAIGGRAILIEGASGSGKSSLALALIDRGASLVGDDGVLLGDIGGVLWAFPHPNTQGLIEIRNVGIARMPSVPAPVALAVTLAEDAPRYIEEAGTRLIEGVAIPALSLWPETPALPLRAEWALSLHGLSLHGLSLSRAIGDSGTR